MGKGGQRPTARLVQIDSGFDTTDLRLSRFPHAYNSAFDATYRASIPVYPEFP